MLLFHADGEPTAESIALALVEAEKQGEDNAYHNGYTRDRVVYFKSYVDAMKQKHDTDLTTAREEVHALHTERTQLAAENARVREVVSKYLNEERWRQNLADIELIGILSPTPSPLVSDFLRCREAIEKLRERAAWTYTGGNGASLIEFGAEMIGVESAYRTLVCKDPLDAILGPEPNPEKPERDIFEHGQIGDRFKHHGAERVLKASIYRTGCLAAYSDDDEYCGAWPYSTSDREYITDIRRATPGAKP